MSDTSDSPDDPGLPQARRRCKDSSEWKCNVMKRKRNRGEGYSRVTGRHVEPRCVGPACRDGCYDKITMPIVRDLHKQFWQIGDFGLQNAYIQKNVSIVAVKRRRPVKNPESERRRKNSRTYHLTYENVRFNLCQKGFLGVLGISETRLRTALSSVSPKSSCPRGDKRGRHPCPRRIPPATVARVLQHILSFPTVSSHYTRAKSPHMRYLEGNLNIRKMYRLYMLWMEEFYPEERRVKLGFYRRKFNTFRLGFKPPMTDTCSFCDSMNVQIKKATPDLIDELKEKKKEHLRKARAGQNLMKELAKDKDPDTRCICIDLQQTLPVPRMATSVAYYQKKLWLYNLCIHDLKANVSQFYVWDEVGGGRGSVEIASCLVRWIDQELKKGNFSVLKIVSDNCGGQNKNTNILLTYLREIHSGRLKTIAHYYLIPGHSYMACDRAFGNIEKCIRATGNIYDFKGYCIAIQASQQVRQKVNVMRQSSFLNFEVLQKEVTVRRPKPPYRFMEARRFIVSSRFPEGYYVGMEYSNGPLGTVRLRKGTATTNPASFNISQVDIPQKYESPRLLKPGKVKALRFLLSYIPPASSRYLQFIIHEQEELMQGPEDSSDEEEDVDNTLNDQLDYDDEEEHGEGGVAGGPAPSTSAGGPAPSTSAGGPAPSTSAGGPAASTSAGGPAASTSSQ